MENNLTRYAVLKSRMKSDKEEIESLKDEILAHVQEEGGKIEHDLGNFSVSKGKPRWSYSKELEKMKEDIKVKEVVEQETRVATAEYTEQLTFKEGVI